MTQVTPLADNSRHVAVQVTHDCSWLQETFTDFKGCTPHREDRLYMTGVLRYRDRHSQLGIVTFVSGRNLQCQCAVGIEDPPHRVEEIDPGCFCIDELHGIFAAHSVYNPLHLTVNVVIAEPRSEHIADHSVCLIGNGSGSSHPFNLLGTFDEPQLSEYGCRIDDPSVKCRLNCQIDRDRERRQTDDTHLIPSVKAGEFFNNLSGHINHLQAIMNPHGTADSQQSQYGTEKNGLRLARNR